MFIPKTHNIVMRDDIFNMRYGHLSNPQQLIHNFVYIMYIFHNTITSTSARYGEFITAQILTHESLMSI